MYPAALLLLIFCCVRQLADHHSVLHSVNASQFTQSKAKGRTLCVYIYTEQYASIFIILYTG